MSDDQGLASLLVSDSEALGRSLLRRVLEELPALACSDELGELAASTVRANLEAFAYFLEHGLHSEEIEVPWLSIELARNHARDDVALGDIIRGYRLGQEWLFEELAACAPGHVSDPAALAALVARIGALSFRYVDAVCLRIAEEYAAEEKAAEREGSERRTALVHRLLTGEPVNLTIAEQTLGYRFDGSHLALLIWSHAQSPVDETASIERVAASIVDLLDSGRPLLLSEAPEMLAGWISVPGHRLVPWDSISARLQGTPVTVAAGSVQYGFTGFRETRRQAERARAVAIAMGAEGRLLQYDEVALLSLLVADLEAARAFVAEELRGLADDGETNATLRRTLLALFRLGGHHEAAAALFVHRNTVAHRVRRAEELMGRPLGARRLETEAALLVCEWLGPHEVERSR